MNDSLYGTMPHQIRQHPVRLQGRFSHGQRGTILSASPSFRDPQRAVPSMPDAMVSNQSRNIAPKGSVKEDQPGAPQLKRLVSQAGVQGWESNRASMRRLPANWTAVQQVSCTWSQVPTCSCRLLHLLQCFEEH